MTNSKSSQYPVKFPKSSSRDLVSELRLLAKDAYNTFHQPAISKAADKIERLNQLMDMQGAATADAIRDLESDVERLVAERDRLRAALERISRIADKKNWEIFSITREALAGGKP